MSRQNIQRALAALAFPAAAACLWMGLIGPPGFWPGTLASLTLLTIGFHLASAGSRSE